MYLDFIKFTAEKVDSLYSWKSNSLTQAGQTYLEMHCQELFVFKFKFQFLICTVKFQVLNSHMWPALSALEQRGKYSQSIVGQITLNPLSSCQPLKTVS